MDKCCENCKHLNMFNMCVLLKGNVCGPERGRGFWYYWEPKKDKSIYKQAIDKFGVVAQMGMAQEECAELIVAISKDIRYASIETANCLHEEIADVEIMLEQLKIIFDCHDIIDAVKEKKLDRLKGLIEND